MPIKSGHQYQPSSLLVIPYKCIDVMYRVDGSVTPILVVRTLYIYNTTCVPTCTQFNKDSCVDFSALKVV